MSTLTVSNVSDGTTSVGTTYVTNGSAKAWINFNGTGTIAARDSLNVSSLTDNGTGDYTVNWSSAFGNANYSSVFGTTGAAGDCIYIRSGQANFGNATLRSTTQLRLLSTENGGSSGFDSEEVNTAHMGDIA